MAVTQTQTGPPRPCSSTSSPTACSAPTCAMLGPVADGGHIVANTAPGCWGPMITPAIRGGHEVTLPVAVEGAEVGDAIAIRIRDIDGHLDRDGVGQRPADGGPLQRRPVLRAGLPRLRRRVARDASSRASARSAVRCADCGADATPFTFTNGYTIAFDDARSVGVTVGAGARPRRSPTTRARVAALPDNSVQNPILAVRAARPRRRRRAAAAVHGPARHDARRRPARLAQRRRLRRVPGRRAAPPRAHRGRAAASTRTDGHMDIDAVRAGRDPRLPGQGAGRRRLPGRHARAAGRRRDRRPHLRRRRAPSRSQVEVIKGLGIDGPVLFPVAEDLPFLARPLTDAERARAPRRWPRATASTELEEARRSRSSAPAPTSTAATDNGLGARRRRCSA